MKRKAVNPEAVYREQLAEIGAILRHTREGLCLSLSDAASKTLIRLSLLQAIENGDLPSLPEPVYTRGLIRRYGNVLGLDGEILAGQVFTPPEPQNRSSWKDAPAAQLRPLHLYAAYVLMMALAVSGLSVVIKRTTPEVSNLPSLEPALESPPADETSAPAPSFSQTEPQPTPTVGDHQIRVEMTLTGQSWLRVVSDGDTTFEGILQPGDSRLLTADEALTIRAGNAGSVVVSYNEGAPTKMGEPGMVAEITYPPESQISLAF